MIPLGTAQSRRSRGKLSQNLAQLDQTLSAVIEAPCVVDQEIPHSIAQSEVGTGHRPAGSRDGCAAATGAKVWADWPAQKIQLYSKRPDQSAGPEPVRELGVIPCAVKGRGGGRARQWAQPRRQ